MASILPFVPARRRRVRWAARGRIGRRRLLMALAVVFVVATIGCALAPSVGVLVAFRAVLDSPWASSVTCCPRSSRSSPRPPARARGRPERAMIVGGRRSLRVNADLRRRRRRRPARVALDARARHAARRAVDRDDRGAGIPRAGSPEGARRGRRCARCAWIRRTLDAAGRRTRCGSSPHRMRTAPRPAC
ncbi:hypothetical protein QJS66_07080 [Kocuria rhizophila]|nr:hypothetical protein QJS66_07080 [Kocuria rhizophila]